MFCGMHAINNLLQLPEDERYDYKKMDAIADKMHEREQNIYNESMNDKTVKIRNNHRSKLFYFISTGNYSLEVITEALLLKGYGIEMVKLNMSSEKWQLDDSSVIGVIINVHNLVPMDSTQNMTSLLCCLYTSNRNSSVLKREGISYIRTGGHWFSLGKVYSSPTTPKADDQTITELNIDDISAGGDVYSWYNHDSKNNNAQLLEHGIASFISELQKNREVQMWRVKKL